MCFDVTDFRVKLNKLSPERSSIICFDGIIRFYLVGMAFALFTHYLLTWYSGKPQLTFGHRDINNNY